ncbi:chitin synthase III catalytic subunit [Pseudoneurospora amorphoporcata]|uniref:Chitin synthase export chaperone n=1 Tax=Pseudoneurospora amorphoporcata TaxID=241081 RepID=A0AAN6NQ68_9PEZI|nr:chitin synthase III catalytic subunit [Pseudoneurospora amorphoporcata]
MGAFGDFSSICRKAPIPLCASVGPITSVASGVGIEPDCYARNIEVANTIIFQSAASVMHIVALIMTVVMLLHVRGKFTAVGRKEITTFFYLYMILTFLSLCIDAGVIPPHSGSYPYFVAVQAGLASALVTCLVINGFVGFQLYEDGTPLSLWMLRLSSFIAFVISFLVSLATFKSWSGLGPTNTVGIFIVLYLLNAIQLALYVVSQIILVTRTLQDRWPLGDIAFGLFFFIAGQVLLYAFSSRICEGVSHYIDGLFFATTCNLLAVMMVYKYWDSITKEDLEFSVGTRMNNWEVKELLPQGPEEDRRATVYADPIYEGHHYAPGPGTGSGASASGYEGGHHRRESHGYTPSPHRQSLRY